MIAEDILAKLRVAAILLLLINGAGELAGWSCSSDRSEGDSCLFRFA
jgi:hypothetical protein